MRSIQTLVLAVVVGLVSVGTAAAQMAEPTPKVIRWEKDATTAYNKALQQRKPLVMVFLCPLTQEKCVHCKRFRASLFSDAVGELADEAVYVQVEIDAHNMGKATDNAGRTVFDQLGCKATPTVTILEPNPKMLTEIVRLNGYFTGDVLSRHVRDELARWKSNASKITEPEAVKQVQK